jgi:16S rRNA (cytidine1402-2'-O)-methyltransferase
MPTIYLIPNTLGDSPLNRNIPEYNLEIIRGLKHFAVEGEKAARKFLKQCGVVPPFEGITLHALDKRTSPAELSAILDSIGSGDGGILSEAGCPGVADPGSNLVLAAYARRFSVVPLIGPSSILLALMASGMNGQGFVFHGYIPQGSNERMQQLELENASADTGYTQIFIETPFRNESLFADILRACKQNTLLSIGCDITLPTEDVRTMKIEDWRKTTIVLRNRQAVFSLLAAGRKWKK